MATLLFGGVMGTAPRCLTCEQIELRIVRVPRCNGQVGQYWIDLRGMRYLVITATTSV
jgi:hypothetical protein